MDNTIKGKENGNSISNIWCHNHCSAYSMAITKQHIKVWENQDGFVSTGPGELIKILSK